MKTNYFKKTSSGFLILLSILFIINCSSDDSSGAQPTPELILTGSVSPFAETDVLSFSDSQKHNLD